MAASPGIRSELSLEEFLRLPDIDEAPYVEYIDGRAEAKAMPTQKHTLIEKGMIRRLDRFAEPGGLGLALFEVRHTFGGRSILPDVSFTLAENVALDPDGTPSDRVLSPPDLHVEVISPEQSVAKTHAKLLFSVAHGCSMGLLIHPEKRTIDVYRPGRTPERLPDDGAIDFAPVLPGLIVPVAEVFSWMTVNLRRPGADPA